MTEVTKEMILDYLVKKGGVVKNVDLVRHFRKYLQVENPLQKGVYEGPILKLYGWTLRVRNSAIFVVATSCYGCFSCRYA